MKLRKRFLSFILSISMLGVFIPNIALAEETTEDTTTEETVVDTFEVTINAENYASIYLQNGSEKTADAGYHGSSRAKQLYYNTPYSANDNIYTEHGSIISSYNVPLKNTISNLTVNYYVSKGSGITSSRYIPVFYDTNIFGIEASAASYSNTTDQYTAVATYADNYWCGTGTTSHSFSGKNFASQVAFKITATSTGSLAYDITSTALVALVADTDEEYLTLATGREVSGYTNSALSLKTEARIPYLTATYSKSAILETINASEKADLPELLSDLDAVGLLSNTTAGYTGYSSLIDIAKDYVETELAETITAGGFADLDAFYASYDEHVAFAAENGTLLAINNVKSEEEMTLLIAELGTAGTLENSTSGYAGFTSLSALMEKQVVKELYALVSAGGFADVSAFFTAYDEAVTAAAELSQEDAVTATVSPENYAAIHITDAGYHGYSRSEAVYYNTPYTENAKMYAESGSVISSYKVPLKNMLSAMAINYSINTAGQMSNGHVPVFYDINNFSVDAPAGVYAMTVEDTTTEESTTEDTTTEDTTTGDTTTGDTTTEDTTDTDSGLDEEEEPGGSVDIPTEEDTPEEPSVDVYAAVLDYTSNYWPASGYSYTNSNVAYKITSSSTGRLSHDVTNTAMKAYIADETAEYLTFATGRETSGYINFSMNVSTASTIPTLTLTYDAAKLVDYINSAESADALDEILATLNEAGIFSNSLYGYAAYTGVGEKYKSEIRETLYEQVADGGYLKFIDFINTYDETVLFVANNVINNPDVLINFNDETASDISGNNKNAQIVGDATFTVGPDGSKALKITNTFGKTAQQYLNMGEYDLSSDSFSIVFWMKAPGRGIDFEESGDQIASGTVVDFSTYTGTKGGVVLSNKDFSVNNNTGFAFAAMPRYTDFSYNMKLGENSVINTVGVQRAADSRWHQLSYVVNRSGNATFYVDNVVIKATDISKLDGSMGIGDIIFGADGLGQYGMMKGEFDEIRIYSSALESSKIEELYYKTALNKLNNDIETLLSSNNATVYSDENISALEEQLNLSKEFVANYEVGSLDSLVAQYNALDEYYNTFLNKDVKGTIAFGSDVHISESSETHLSAQNLKRFLTESADWENPAKSFILSGDISDVGADDMGYLFSHLSKWVVDGSNMVICRGNHDEPAGKNNATGETLTRTQLKDLFVNNMDTYVDKTLSLNADVINSDGVLAQPFYYSTDGVAHYITIDNYWPTVRSISDTQFIWLEKVLNTVSGDGKPIFVVQHLPLLNSTASSSYLGLDEADDAQLKELLKKHDNVFVLNGHSHHGFGGGSGNPVDFDGFYMINAPILASKNIHRGYEWASGYYINVYDDRVVFRARDYENQKWLRDYDLTFALTPASEETAMGDIKLINTTDNTEYADISEASGNTVKIQVPVRFIDETAESFETILSLYSDTGLLSAKTGTVLVTDEYIEFEVTIPENTNTIKVMCWDSTENMKPICEAAVLTAVSHDYTYLTFNIRTETTSDKNLRAWDSRKEAVTEYLNNSGASVICLQEVDSGQYEYINENISEKYESVYYTRETGEDVEGLVIAYDKEIFEKVSDTRFWLSETPDIESIGWDAAYKRICVNALLKDKGNGGILNVFNVHLDHTGLTSQSKGLELVMEKINETDYPAFVAGDFNVTSTSDCYQVISSQMQDCQLAAPISDYGVTFHNWGSNSDYSSTPIDFCFVSKENMKPLTYKICRDKWDGNYYSDHYAVKVKVRVTY